jgi:hypothetical protein
MSESHPLQLALTAAAAFMRKISNNLLNIGDDKITAFTLPIDGVVLKAEALDALLGKYTHRSWFDKHKDGSAHPMPWVVALPGGGIALECEFECEGVEIVVGRKTLVFESEEGEDGSESVPAARIKSLVLTPRAGGDTLLAFHLQVRPGLGDENLALQRCQHSNIVLTLGDTKLAEAKRKQQELPLEQGESEQATAH